MLKSMTGFGRAEGRTALGRVLVESRSVNHRYCDINVKLPKGLIPLEQRIKELIRSYVSRGRVDLVLKIEGNGEKGPDLTIDLKLAEQYLHLLQTLKDQFQLKGEITLELLASFSDLIIPKEEVVEIEPYWEELQPILHQALQTMDEMKRLEGEALAKDLKERTRRIREQMEEIKKIFPLHLEQYQRRLKERIQHLLRDEEVDPLRFQQEVAFLAERMDITEEMIRVESHLDQLNHLFHGEEPVGRKMDFLIQEIHREVNTLSSKANEATISQRVVEIKSELEKIREQVQNIE